MRRWLFWVIPIALVIALIGTGYWGYTEQKSRQAMQNRAESQYQRAFHELAWHVDTIAGQLAQLLVSSSREQNIIGLATLWRQAFAAQSNLGALPLALVPLSKTEKLLADTTDVSYAYLSRTAQGTEPLGENELKVIQDLYERAKGLKEDLDKLSAQILNQQLSWTQVEVATLQANQDLEDNTIVNGFQLAEKRLEEYPEIELGEDFANVRPDTKVIRGEQQITLEQAQEIAHKWWYPAQDRHVSIMSYEGVGDVPTYGLEFTPQQGESSPVYIDVSKLDGTVLWAMKPKDISGVNIDISEGERQSRNFLQSRGFPEMALIKVEQEDNTGVYTFVPSQDGVLLYPDQVKVQVALDNGEVIGYEGTPYYMNHKQREIPAPRLSEEDIRRQVSPLLKVELIRPALIANPWGKEILTWEVRGSFQEEKFVIFYNAQSGSEEEITRITPPPKFEYVVAG